jgi:hypothetical protein
MIRTLFLFSICLININFVYSEIRYDTLHCKVLYNDFNQRRFSLHFDGGDQIHFTPNFFLLKDSKITDTGFLYTDSIDYKLFNDTNHILSFSKRLKRRLKKLNAPGKDYYNGYHFYLFEAIIVLEKGLETKFSSWPSSLNKYGSEDKNGIIRRIYKIIKLTPVKSKSNRINKKNIVQ